MGWRFRRSLTVLPGVRLNISKRSAGLSFGPRGAKVSVNTRGEVRKTVSIPGTGLSHTTQSKLKLSDPVLSETATPNELLSPEAPGDWRSAQRRALRRKLGWSTVVVFTVLILGGAASAAGAIIIPAVAVTLLGPHIIYR